MNINGKNSMRKNAFHGEPLGAALRCVQLYFIVLLLISLITGAVAAPKNFEYDLSLVCLLFLAGASTLSIWIVQVRSVRARAVCIASALIGNALMFTDLHLGTFSKVSAYISVFAQLPESAASAAINVFFLIEVLASVGVLIYLGTSKTAKAVLCIEYKYNDTPGGQTWDTPPLKRLSSWFFWRDIAIYFIVFSFLGHWAEIAFCQLIRLGVVMGDYDPTNDMLWNQWLYPFSAEGIAVALIVLLLHPISRVLLKKMGGRYLPAVVASFFVNMIVCASIDFTLGITTNADYHLWDYRSMPFNFMGQVCLQNTLVYTTAATLIVWIVYPAMDKLLRRASQLLLDAAFWFLAGVYGFCALLHFMYLTPWGFIIG